MCWLREPQATRILHKKTFANYFDKGFFVTSAEYNLLKFFYGFIDFVALLLEF
jgi:hypothetical protein